MTMIPTVIDFNSIACGGVRAKVEDHDLLIGDQRVLPNSKLPLLPKLLKGFLDATTAELQNELVRTAEEELSRHRSRSIRDKHRWLMFAPRM